MTINIFTISVDMTLTKVYIECIVSVKYTLTLN